MDSNETCISELGAPKTFRLRLQFLKLHILYSVRNIGGFFKTKI
jgi:hypothetical protein